MGIAVLAQLLSSLGTLVVVAGILYQGRQARKARDDTDRPQIIVDADYTGRFTTNIVVRNIGNGTAKNITFEFSAPLQTTSGRDITELPYFRHGINFMAPKFFVYGVIDSGTAWLDEPDAMGAGTVPYWPDPAAYDAAVALFAGSGFQLVTHAIGDRAVRSALDAYRAAGAAPGLRHRVEHAQTLKDAELARFAREGVTASMQPLHMQWLRADMTDSWSRRLGPERAVRSFRIKHLVGSGATVALGSDWPVAHFDPRLGMAWARLRRAPGEREAQPLSPDQRLSGLEALEGYTTGAARAVGEESTGGAIKPGPRADLAAFARDPVDCDPDDLPGVAVVLTVVGGRIVFGDANVV